MSNREQLEQYWHWFHGLVGISQKEKEVLLKLCPEVKIWYEFAKQKKTADIFLYEQEKQQKKDDYL